MNITYRKSEAKDMPFILDMLAKFSGDIQDIIPNQFLVAEDEGKIVGCVRIRNIEGHLKLASIIVLPDYRKKRIGSNLVTKIINENPEKPIYLFCHKENDGFYAKLGFKVAEINNIPEVFKKSSFAKSDETVINMVFQIIAD